jgi:hypothetical protein
MIKENKLEKMEENRTVSFSSFGSINLLGGDMGIS